MYLRAQVSLVAHHHYGERGASPGHHQLPQLAYLHNKRVQTSSTIHQSIGDSPGHHQLPQLAYLHNKPVQTSSTIHQSTGGRQYLLTSISSHSCKSFQNHFLFVQNNTLLHCCTVQDKKNIDQPTNSAQKSIYSNIISRKRANTFSENQKGNFCKYLLSKLLRNIIKLRK